MIPTKTSALLAAFLIALPCLAPAQPNPLDRKVGGPEAVAPPGTRIEVPEYIRTGARLIYYGGSSTEDPDPNKIGSAGLGMTRYDVVAVTDDHVLLTAHTYLGTGRRDQFTWMGAMAVSLNALSVQMGEALWMPKASLAQMQSGNGIDVRRGPWPMHGVSYQAVVITIEDAQSKSRRVYDEGTGLKLSDQMASGPFRRGGGQNEGFNRKDQSHMQFETIRQPNWPWLEEPAPAWVAKVKRVQWQGARTVTIPGSQPISIGMRSTFEVKQRGPNWLVGKTTLETESFGFPTPPTVVDVVEGPGKVFSLWIAPKGLAKLRPGRIDRDETLKNSIHYEVRDGQLGRLGLLTESNDTDSYRVTAGYDLENGMLTYVSYSVRDTNTNITLQLSGWE